MSDTATPVTMGPAKPIVSHHYVSREQQSETAFVGMWLFLVQEIMFFGGLFVAYGVYRYKYPITWYEGSAHMLFGWGTFNTIVLLLSSVTMASCVWATQVGRWRIQISMLCGTIFLGIVFLVVKWIEYSAKWQHELVPGLHWNPDPLAFTDPARAELFFILYFIMTGMHAFHMIIGIAIASVLLVLCLRREYGPNKYLPIELFGFYWHFVDIVWVFLYPMFYLISSPAGHH